MKAEDTLVPSTKIHSVTFQMTVILTLLENLWSHILCSFQTTTESSLPLALYYRYLQTTLELTRWIIYVGNRLTAEVALQVRILYFFYLVSMIHKMAASYTTDAFKVNEFPLIISAAPIISLYRTMCWATTHVRKLASPLQQRVLFNQSLNFIYWETPITTMNISCISITHKGSASNINVYSQEGALLRHTDSSRTGIFVVSPVFFSVQGPPHT